MHNYDKAKILADRHIKITIEWGGSEYFTHASDMTRDGVVEFLDILDLNESALIHRKLTELIQKEDDKQN